MYSCTHRKVQCALVSQALNQTKKKETNWRRDEEMNKTKNYAAKYELSC